MAAARQAKAYNNGVRECQRRQVLAVASHSANNLHGRGEKKSLGSTGWLWGGRKRESQSSVDIEKSDKIWAPLVPGSLWLGRRISIGYSRQGVVGRFAASPGRSPPPQNAAALHRNSTPQCRSPLEVAAARRRSLSRAASDEFVSAGRRRPTVAGATCFFPPHRSCRPGEPRTFCQHYPRRLRPAAAERPQATGHAAC